MQGGIMRAAFYRSAQPIWAAQMFWISQARTTRQKQ
jgi:hypothetical protein